MQIDKNKWKGYIQRFIKIRNEGIEKLWELCDVVKELADEFVGSREAKRKEIFTKFANEIQYSVSSVYRMWQLAVRFPKEKRILDGRTLPIAICAEAISFSRPEEIIKKAMEENLSVREVREIIKGEKTSKPKKLKELENELFSLKQIKSAFLQFMFQIGFVKERDKEILWKQFLEILGKEKK